MHKKLMIAFLAAVALAGFVIAPTASASPVWTINGTPAPTGTVFTGTTTGLARFTGGLDVKCHGHVTGALTQNNGTKIKGEIGVGAILFTGTDSGEDCTSAFGPIRVTVTSKLCFETITGTDSVLSTGCSSNVTFAFSVTGGMLCKYSAASVTGTYVTNSDATINIVEQPAKKVENVFCPEEGKLDMDFDITTSTGTTILTS